MFLTSFKLSRSVSLLLLLCFCFVFEVVAEEELNWTKLALSTKPSPRYDAAMAYDYDNNCTILFGGKGVDPDGVGYISINDMWKYQDNQWTQLTLPDGSPPSRYGACMVYDSCRNTLVLFGGYGEDDSFLRYYNDLWEYRVLENRWTNLIPQGKSGSPSSRRLASMAYDEKAKRIVLFGGYSGDELNDTWTYDPATNKWSQMFPSSKPSSREGACMAYDPVAGGVILFGGLDYYSGNHKVYNDTWLYPSSASGTAPWINKAPASSPRTRAYAGMASKAFLDCDTAVQTGPIILFGGLGYDGRNAIGLNDTWQYKADSNQWTKLNPATTPTTLSRAIMAYDVKSDQVLLFGGQAGAGGASQNTTYALAPLVASAEAVTVEQTKGREFGVAAKKKNNRRNYTDIVKWKAPLNNELIVAYRIFRHKRLEKPIADIPSSQLLIFKDGNRNPRKTYKYFIVSVDKFGNCSEPAFGEIKGKRFCHQ